MVFCEKKTILLLLSLGLSIFGCKKPVDDTTSITIPLQNGLIVLNEGTFNFNTASVSFLGEDTSLHHIFQTQNDRILGDVAQSITFYEDKAYIVVNNSNKIEVVQANDFVHQKTVQNLVSPRYLQPISETKAYITNFYQARIDVFDLVNDAVTHSLTFDCPPDIPDYECGFNKMASIDGRLWVSHISLPELWVFDTENDSLLHTITLDFMVNDMLLDENNMLWVASFELEGEGGKLYQIDPITTEILQQIPLNNLKGFYKNLSLHENQLYLSGKETIYTLNVNENPATPTLFYENETLNIYGIATTSDGTIYLTEALDFLQQGFIFRLNPDTKVLTDTLQGGIIPSQVYER